MTEETKIIEQPRSPAEERGRDTSSPAPGEYTEPRRHRRRMHSKKAHSRKFMKKASSRLLVALLIVLVAVIGAAITVGLVEFFSYSSGSSS